MAIFEDGITKDMQEARSWRELLGMIISDPREKQRIAQELGVRVITLTRWVSGESDPRIQNLRYLLDVVPKHREQLSELIREEAAFDDFTESQRQDPSKVIPAEFYTKVLVALASSSPNLRFWSTCNLILQQAMGQLDPDRLGMSIWIVRCMPPSGPHKKVRSLREIVGLGTPPWAGNLEQKGMFLGAESLSGNVVTLCRPGIIENLDEQYNLPASRVEYEKSAAVYPILYAGRIAGTFLVSSTQYNYFLSQSRTTLAQSYADLVALVFDSEDFYDPADISLCIMPSHIEQKSYFARFRQLVANKMIESSQHGQPLNNIQADHYAWQYLEDELLRHVARQENGR